MARLCAQKLPTGKTCARFTLKGEHWCPAHRDPDRRNQAEMNRLIVESIPEMDMPTIVALLLSTLRSLRTQCTTPLHAQTVFAAASLRLDEMYAEVQAYISRAESESYTLRHNGIR